MVDIENRNYYELLGIEEDASVEEIKEAYHDIARVFHPDSRFYDEIIEDRDLTEEHNRLFKVITSAYHTLTNDEKRREYDAQLASGTAVELDMSQFNSEVWRNWDKPTRDGPTARRPRRGTRTWGSFGVVREELQRQMQMERPPEPVERPRRPTPRQSYQRPTEKVRTMRSQRGPSKVVLFLYFGVCMIVGIAAFFFAVKFL